MTEIAKMTSILLSSGRDIFSVHSFFVLRHLSTSCNRNAGFQASQTGLSMEVKQRLIERKKKKIEKLMKQPLEEIPIIDYFIPYSWKTKAKKRKNLELSEDLKEQRILLEKQWVAIITEQHKIMQEKMKKLKISQEKALHELHHESPFLYNAALKCLDISEFSFSCRGPVQTMPLVAYLPPLGGFLHKEPPFCSDDTTLPDSDD